MLMDDYRALFYLDSRTGKMPVKEYINALDTKTAAKVLKYIDFLREHKGYLDEPYSKHLRGSIRELRIDFGKDRHRVLYFTFVKKQIILLHAFLKKTPKTPERDIQTALERQHDVISNAHLYA